MKMSVNSIKDILVFGKYKGLTIEETLYTNHNYIRWMIKNNIVTFSPEILEFLNKEISQLILDGYNTPSNSDWGGLESACDDPFYGWQPH